MRQLSSDLRGQDRHDLGAVLSIASRQRPKMIEWILSLSARAVTNSKLISIQRKGEIKMAKENMSMASDTGMSGKMGMNGQGGHLYMQTNEIKNIIVHYQRSPNGTLTEVQRVATGGAGSGTFKPISGQESAPNAFEGAGSVILTPDRRFLFATNGGDNSVSSFAVGEQGQLKLIDTKPTGNVVEGKAEPPNLWPISPRRACCSCCTHSAPTISG